MAMPKNNTSLLGSHFEVYYENSCPNINPYVLFKSKWPFFLTTAQNVTAQNVQHETLISILKIYMWNTS